MGQQIIAPSVQQVKREAEEGQAKRTPLDCGQGILRYAAAQLLRMLVSIAYDIQASMLSRVLSLSKPALSMVEGDGARSVSKHPRYLHPLKCCRRYSVSYWAASASCFRAETGSCRGWKQGSATDSVKWLYP